MAKLWFKAKKYGYGWYPATWEGWTVLGIFIVLFVAGESFFIYGLNDGANPDIFVPLFLAYTTIITGSLIWISAKRGEPARWRWGEDESKNNER